MLCQSKDLAVVLDSLDGWRTADRDTVWQAIENAGLDTTSRQYVFEKQQKLAPVHQASYPPVTPHLDIKGLAGKDINCKRFPCCRVILRFKDDAGSDELGNVDPAKNEGIAAVMRVLLLTCVSFAFLNSKGGIDQKSPVTDGCGN
jgi:hypothetical protein